MYMPGFQIINHNNVLSSMKEDNTLFFKMYLYPPFHLCLFQLIDRTCMTPTPALEQHLMWDDIAILLRYLLMLSFNNSLDGELTIHK